MSIDAMVYPAPPRREDWGFLQELRTRAVRHVCWTRKAGAGELDLSGGICLHNEFPDDSGCLATAFADIEVFAGDTGLALAPAGSTNAKGVPLRLTRAVVDGRESYVMEVTPSGITLTAEDSEGMRRAIFYFEDMLSGQDGPYLPYGRSVRKPWLKNRISRCFFGPIKRPPFNRDELMDDMDYYPDEYLNRLAHEGINGLWLTVVFSEIAETSFRKRDADAPRRLAKLRRTIAQCLRYGIKTWIFAIEPSWIAADDPLLKTHPEFAGAKLGDGVNYAFCPSSPAAQQFLYETMKDIFTQLPGLGGFLNISHGERATNCLSTVPANSNAEVKCPRCSKLPKWKIHYETTEAMIRGMRAANPEAELISWLYQPQPTQVRGDWLYELTRHVPEGVILQYNFESGAQKKQLDRVRSGGDYWLSFVGPTEIFARVADNVRLSGGQLSAKIQVGCSHEVATVPFVSVPGLLYEKYRAMKACGCTSVMQCWYFGNYPGIMNRAAGELAFETFEDSEADFLLRLARPQWGRKAEAVARAWGHFTEGYSYYPLSNDMQYYGPMHAGITWPMFLDIENKPLGPTWKPDFPPSGDTIGECLENHTLEEALTLAERMVLNWDQGMQILDKLRNDFANDRERLLDIGVSEALALQFRSARNIFKYYLLRKTLRCRCTAREKKENALGRMLELLWDEVKNATRMSELCQEDSRLGFHSEAEAHQYCTGRLQWRIAQIKELIGTRFKDAETELAETGHFTDKSAYAATCESCMADGTWNVQDCTAWAISQHEEYVTIHLKSTSAPGDSFTLTLMDDYGTSFPWTIRLTNGSYSDSNNAVTVTFLPNQDGSAGWSADIEVPLLPWHLERAGAFYLYLQHDARNSDNTPYRYTWPAEKERPRYRLNIEAFQADHCGHVMLLDPETHGHDGE